MKIINPDTLPGSVAQKETFNERQKPQERREETAKEEVTAPAKDGHYSRGEE